MRQVKAISQVGQRRRRRRCKMIRQMAHSIAVPQFKAAECRWTFLQTYLVQKHLRRCDDPRKISGRHVTHLAYPRALTRMIIGASEPVLRPRVVRFAVRFSCTTNNNNNATRTRNMKHSAHAQTLIVVNVPWTGITGMPIYSSNVQCDVR